MKIIDWRTLALGTMLGLCATVVADDLPRYQNGQIKEQYVMIDGKKQGPAVSYYDNGQKQYEATFKDGYLTGRWTQYHPNGKIWMTGEAMGSDGERNNIGVPLRNGLWIEYHSNGNKKDERSYLENIASGPAVSYYDNGQKQYEATFKDGYLTGRWTQYHPNGKIWMTGEAMGSDGGRNSIGVPLRNGLWIEYHSNGNKKDERSYVENIASGTAVSYYDNGQKQYEAIFKDGYLIGRWTQYHPNGKIWVTGEAMGSDGGRNNIGVPLRSGQWLFLKSDGSLEKVLNYAEGKPTGESAYSTDPETGVTTIATNNPDGSRQITKIDKDGNILKDKDSVLPEERDPLALDGEKIVAMSTDPGTGQIRIVRKLPDGTTTASTGHKTTDKDGTQRIVETDDKGNRRETTITSEGEITVRKDEPSASTTTVHVTPDGRTTAVVREPEGYVKTTTLTKDGALVTQHRDLNGEVVQTVVQRADGWTEKIDRHGNRSASITDASGITTTVEVDRSGNTTTTLTDVEGAVLARDRQLVVPLEPGREYYETQLNGTDWASLPQSMKTRFANSERSLLETQQRQAEVEARALADERKALEVQAANAKDQAETDRKLAAIAAEQEKANQAAALRKARLAREQELAQSYQAARELQSQYDAAVARGDQKEAARILALQDEQHAKSMELLMPTAGEQAAMERQSEVRAQLVSEVTRQAHSIAAHQNSENDSLQDVKENITDVTKWVSIGSEMQNSTAGATRQADRERAYAQAKQQVITDMLKRDELTNEQRQMLTEMHDLAQLQEDGAVGVLNANARITTAGYAIDAALLLSGAKLVEGAGQAATMAAGKVLSEQTAVEVGRALTQRSLLNTAGSATTHATVSATRRVVSDEAAAAIERLLTTDMGHVSREAASAAARRVLGKEAASAGVTNVPGLTHFGPNSPTIRGDAVTLAGPTSPAVIDDLTSKTHIDIPPSKMPLAQRQAYHNRQAQRAVNEHRGSASFSEIVGEDILPGPIYHQPNIADFTLTELARLHQPGRNLTSAEIMRKAEIYRLREEARRLGINAIQNGAPDSVVNELTQRYQSLNYAIERARQLAR